MKQALKLIRMVTGKEVQAKMSIVSSQKNETVLEFMYQVTKLMIKVQVINNNEKYNVCFGGIVLGLGYPEKLSILEIVFES